MEPIQPNAGIMSRRQLLRYGGMAAVTAAAAGSGMKLLRPAAAGPVTLRAAQGSDTATRAPDVFLGGTDGWMYLPPDPPVGIFHPDNLAPTGLTTYIFGFRNITDLTATQRQAQKNHAQHQAPLFWVKESIPGDPSTDFVVDITNLGLAQRPDLFDAHTLHWHGFRNAIPFFDGEPTGSVSVPAGTVFRYVYRPYDPGTYMYHCHVEDVEHVHMGMNGIVFVRPRQDGNTAFYDSGKYLYNDGDGSTGYDREYVMFLSEVWAESHWADAHIQLPEWSDYRADFALLNGRVYPDTILPGAPFPSTMPDGVTPFDAGTWADTVPYLPAQTDASGDLVAAGSDDRLRYQPISSLVECNRGERLAFRFANLGFREAAMTITGGLSMRVVGRDATPMRGRVAGGARTGIDTSYTTDTINIGPGQSYDVIVEVPEDQPEGTYMLYNRSFKRSDNQSSDDVGGQATEIRVSAGDVPAQILPNT
ncbi:MAG: multicopper oxidase domain-containing protein [Acidimicrobiales bacterium]